MEHYTSIKIDGFKTLSEGQIVEFKLIKTDWIWLMGYILLSLGQDTCPLKL